MQGFRPFGHGGPYPLPSNLSPLAPPFTVNPYFGSRAGTNTLAGDPFYGGPGFEPLGYEAQLGPDNWPRPSNPSCLHDPFRSPNTSSVTGANTGTSSVHPGAGAASYDQFISNYPGPQSGSRNFHPQASSSRVAPERSTSLSAKELGDVLPAPTAPSDAFWDANAKSGEEQWNVGAPSYASFVNHGPGTSVGDNMQQGFAEPSNVWAGKSAVSMAETDSVGTQGTNSPFGRLTSKFENSKNASFDMSKKSVFDPASHPENLSYQRPLPDFSSEPWNHTDPRLYSSNPKRSSHNVDPLGFYPIFPISSTNQFYKSPSINNPPIPTNGAPFNFNLVRPSEPCDTKGTSAHYNSSGPAYIQVNGERRGVYSDTSSSNNGVDESDHTRVDPSMLDASEILEQFNPGVDSPCWKGASESQYSLFGAAEAGLPYIPTEISGFNDLNLQGSHNHPSKSDNVADVSSPRGSGKCTGKDSSASFLKQSSPIACPLSGNMDGGSHLESSQTVEACDISREPTCNDRNADVRVGAKDATLFGSSLPSARCSVPIFDLNVPKLHDESLVNSPGSKLSKSQAVVNSMLVMSEMLLSYCTEDFGAMKEQEHAVIQQVIQNLDGCVFLTGSASSVPKTQVLPSETANSSGKQTNIDKPVQGLEGAQSQVSNTKEKDGQNACKGKKSASMFSTKKDSSPLRAVPASNQELEQDDLSKGIQKILEASLQEDDESDSQGLLYKKLWLEAESALCFLKFKERFARLKLGMQESENHTEKGKEPVAVDKLPSMEATPEPKMYNLVESSSVESEESEETEGSEYSEDDTEGSEEIESSEDSIDGDEVPEALEQSLAQSTTTEDDNASVMARFRILKSRLEHTAPVNKEDKPHDSIDGGFCPGSKGSLQNVSIQIAEDIGAKQQSSVIDLNIPDREQGWPFIKGHFMPHVMEHGEVTFGPMQSAPKAHVVKDGTVSGKLSSQAEFGSMQYAAAAANILADKFSAGECSSPSSEWEHVLKDAEWPA